MSEYRQTHTDELRRWGLGRVLYRYFMARIRPWFFLCRVNVRKLDGSQGENERYDERPATREELLAAASDMPEVLSREFVESALARGDVCVAVFDQGRIVAFGWRAYGPAPHTDGLWVDFDQPARYGYKAYTKPEYRGMHIRDPRRRDDLCRARGVALAIGFIETHNYPSIRSAMRTGNVNVGYAGYLKLGGRIWPFRTRGAARYGFRFFKPESEPGDTRPTVH